uniref:Elongation factor Ts, mitochondrial n=1 Tax=Hemiselmis andersenii TaxID=464988 RepID=A0A7S1H3H1_HEMAN|mmetsp:Transcript_36986/g.89789  ORF Transcript_36986/g.89789 Transcript_36986/m.89789 type:complete len:147 (+) Transcript_36986:1-441(+)
MHTGMGEGLGKVGVLVGLESETKDTDGLAQLGYSLAMHVAAAKPLYCNVADIPQEDEDREKNVFVQQAQESGKSKEIAEKMTAGRIKKWHEDVVLHEQVYLIGGDGKAKVAKVLEEASASLGSKVTLTGFARIKCGETNDEPKKED